MNQKEPISQPEKAESAVGKAVSYEVEVEPSGVFLTVFPSLSVDQRPNSEEIHAELLRQNLHTVQKDLIIKAIASSTGKPVLIGDYPGPQDPEVKVEISKNKMEATVEIIPSRKKASPTLNEIYARLKEKGIISGITEQDVIKALDNPKKPVVVARGKLPQDGVNARIEYAFDFSKTGKPREEADGRVNFFDLNLVYNVRAEDVLAEKIAKTDGIPGCTVTGDPIQAKGGRDVPLPLGKNVYAAENGLLRAAIDGQVQMVNGKFHVSPVFEIKEDVDVSTGSISFVGSVIVRGSVQMGFSIKAEGDIEVYGTVSGAILEGNNILVKSGIQGMQRGHIRARGNVTAKFIENANVSAQDTITVAEAILHSNISAGKKVIVQGKRAVIVGGTVRAGEEIVSRSAGSHLATLTTLEVGLNPELRDEMVKVKNEIKDTQWRMEQAQKALQLLKNMEANGTITPEKKELLLKTTKVYYTLTGQHETLRKRYAAIEEQIEELKYGRVKVAETVHPGVKIVIRSAILPVRDPVNYATFYEEDGDIKIGPYK